MQYKCYVLDQAGRVDRPPVVLECSDDHEALERAKRYVDGTGVELWQEKRLVAKLDSE